MKPVFLIFLWGGGLSYPAISATDFGYTIAKQFGINTIPPKPALVPLMFSSEEFRIFKELSGISIDSLVTCNKRTFRGNILFTHKGLSGPAILNISLYYNPGDKIQINLMPDRNFYDVLISKRQSRMMISTLLSQFFPDRFSHAFCESYIDQKMLNQYSDKELPADRHLQSTLTNPQADANMTLILVNLYGGQYYENIIAIRSQDEV